MILPFTDRSTANGSYPPFAQRWEARRPFAIGCITLFSLLFTSHINPEPGKSIQGEPAPARNKATSEIVVSAASSLTNVMQRIGPAFAKQTGIRPVFQFAGSGHLVRQIEQGAPADVLISADEWGMRSAIDAGLVEDGVQTVAYNSLALVTPAANKTVRTVYDLLSPQVLRIAMGDPQFVPAGRYGERALIKMGLYGLVYSKLLLTANVRQALQYVVQGEVDAAIVYRSDYQLKSSELRLIAVLNPGIQIRYPAAVVAASSHKSSAIQFIQFMKKSTAMHRALLLFGFEPAK